MNKMKSISALVIVIALGFASCEYDRDELEQMAAVGGNSSDTSSLLIHTNIIGQVSIAGYLMQVTNALENLNIPENINIDKIQSPFSISNIDLDAFAVIIGKETANANINDTITQRELRWNDANTVLRIRRDRQYLSGFCGDRQFDPQKGNLLPVTKDRAIYLADSYNKYLGIPSEELSLPVTDTITYGYENLTSKTEKKYEGNRVVIYNRIIAGYEVMVDRVYYMFSNSGELASLRVQWPAFKTSDLGKSIKKKELIAQEIANSIDKTAVGAPIQVDGDPEIVWLPDRDSDPIQYSLQVKMTVVEDRTKEHSNPGGFDIYTPIYQ